MTYRKTIFFILFTVLFTLVFSKHSLSGESSQIIKKITTEKAHEIIKESSNDSNLLILDVRTPSEHESAHLNNSININYKDESFRKEISKLDKNKTYIIHCRSGGRSAKALEIMEELNFKEVYDMGGILEWQEKGYKVIKQPQSN